TSTLWYTLNLQCRTMSQPAHPAVHVHTNQLESDYRWTNSLLDNLLSATDEGEEERPGLGSEDFHIFVSRRATEQEIWGMMGWMESLFYSRESCWGGARNG